MEENRTRRVVKIAGLLLLLGATLVWGMIVGGGLVFAWTQLRGESDRNAAGRGEVVAEGMLPGLELFRGRAIPGIRPEAGVVVTSGGAYVVSVVSGGPADEAGLQSGDQILALDGQELDGSQSLGELLADYAPGEWVVLSVTRPNGEAARVRVRLAENPDRAGRAYLGIEYQMAQGPAAGGVQVMPFGPESFRLDLPFDGQGRVPQCRCECK